MVEKKVLRFLSKLAHLYFKKNKKKTIHHHPSVKLKNFVNQKRSILEGVFEIKKLFLGGTIKEKEINLGPHRGSPKG